jgi:hypothetical protein
MSFSVGQVTELVQQLYGSSAEETRQADAVLKTWQASEGAWQVALLGLGAAQSDSVRYFFAQTLRSKIQLDFYQLGATASALAVKQQLLLEAFSKSQSAATLTQLLLALADLSVQLDDLWQDALGELIAAAGERVDVLLEVLRLLPEELENDRMVVDAAKRDSCRTRLQRRFPEVHGFFQSVVPQGVTKQKLFSSFLAWLRLAVPSEGDLASSGVFARILEDLPHDLALDVVLEVLNANAQQPTLYPRIVRDAILPRLVRLDILAAESQELVKVSRVLTLCANSLMEAGVLSPEATVSQADGNVVQLIQKLTALVAWHPTDDDDDDDAIADVNLGPLEVFQDLALDTPAGPADGSGPAGPLAGVFQEVLDAIIRRLTAAPASETTAVVRPQALATARAMIRALGMDATGRKLLVAFGASFGSNPAANDAIGSVLVEAIETGFKVSADALGEVVEVLIKVVQSSASRQRGTCLRLLGSLGEDLPLNGGLLEKAMEAVSALLLSGGGGPDEEVMAAKTLRSLVTSQKEAIARTRPEYVAGLCGVLKANKIRSSVAQTLLVETVIAVLNLVQDDAFFCAQLADALEPLLKRVAAAAAGGVAVRNELDQVTAICRTLRVRRPLRGPAEGAGGVDEGKKRAEFFGRVVAPVLWQSVEGALMGSRGDEAGVEKACRVVKHFIRVDREAVSYLVPVICERMFTEYSTNPTLSSYLYVAEILADAYGAEDATPEPLVQLFDRMTNVALVAVSTAAGGSQELLAEDLFGMGSRFLRYATPVVFRSPHFANLLATAIKLLPNIRRRETFDAIVSFLSSIFETVASGVSNAPTAVVQEAVSPALGAAIAVVREGAGEDLLVLVAALLESVGKIVPLASSGLLAAALDRELPTGILTTANERNAAVADLAGETRGHCLRRLLELGKRCNQRIRRR